MDAASARSTATSSMVTVGGLSSLEEFTSNPTIGASEVLPEDAIAMPAGRELTYMKIDGQITLFLTQDEVPTVHVRRHWRFWQCGKQHHL